jgi:uncharacterized membrane protein YgdD (TMEM256/DUF423 family)
MFTMMHALATLVVWVFKKNKTMCFKTSAAKERFV